MSLTTPSRHPARDLGLDVARGMGMVVMFVGHFAPSTGPGLLLNFLVEDLQSLFVAVIGAGAAWPSRRRWPEKAARTVGRVTVLALAAWLIMDLPAQIDQILFHLVFTSLIAMVLILLPSWLLATMGVLSVVTTPMVYDALMSRLPAHVAAGDTLWVETAQLVAASPHYRLWTFVAYLVLGILVTRHLRGGTAPMAWTAAGSLGLAALIKLGYGLDLWDAAPYAPTVLSTVSSATLALGILTACLALGPVMGRWLQPIAAIGNASLSLYALQVVVAAWWVTDGGHTHDNSWILMIGLIVGSALLAELWARFLPGRGPIEWVGEQVATLLGAPFAGQRLAEPRTS